MLGEVNQPGRYTMNDIPTTVLGAIAMASGHVTGANLRQVVVFRRGENWELLSTMLDLQGAILGRTAHPADEIWVRDGDMIILLSTPIGLFSNFLRQVFTNGVYSVIPLNGMYNVNEITGLSVSSGKPTSCNGRCKSKGSTPLARNSFFGGFLLTLL